MNQNATEDALTQTIMQLIEEKKPRNVKELVDLAKNETSFREKNIIEFVLQLQSRGKIRLSELPAKPPQKLSAYLRSNETYWYWSLLILTVATTLIVLTVPDNSFPLVYLRYVLGAIFIFWLPGNSFIRALFPAQNQSEKSTRLLDLAERTALSLVMSLAIVAIVGLILNSTPWGIRLTPIVISLFLLTTIFATVSVTREYGNRIRIKTA